VGKKAAGLHKRPAKLKGDLGKTFFSIYLDVPCTRNISIFSKISRARQKKQPALPQAGCLKGGIDIIQPLQIIQTRDLAKYCCFFGIFA